MTKEPRDLAGLFLLTAPPKDFNMARKPNYGYEKRQKELAKQAKKEEKKKRRQDEKAQSETAAPDGPASEEE